MDTVVARYRIKKAKGKNPLKYCIINKVLEERNYRHYWLTEIVYGLLVSSWDYIELIKCFGKVAS